MLTVGLIPPDALVRYTQVPISFWVESILRVEPVAGGLQGLALVEEAVASPYLKDYDSYERPTDWPTQFDVSRWAFLLAEENGRAVGAATVVFDTPAVDMLVGRRDMSVLWDIRVRPGYRGQGIGHTLFQRAAAWSRERGCALMKIETQNVNVRACRFYARQGCILGGIDRYGYAAVPSVAHETMLLWYLAL